MSVLLAKALEQVNALPSDEQDVIASLILESLSDEASWRQRFAEKREIIQRMAREAIAEDDSCETMPLSALLDA